MGQTAKVKMQESGNVFIREELDRDWDSDSVLVDNSAGTAELSLPAGTPLTAAVPTVAAGINALTGLVIVSTIIPAGEKQLVAVFTRGTGIVVNRSQLPTHDIAANAALNMTTFVTRLAALGFVMRTESAAQNIQTT